MQQYLLPLAFLITFVFIIVRRPHRQNITINVQHSLGQQSEKYREGYIRATEMIRNGSDADDLLSKIVFDTDWDKGFKDACKSHIEKTKPETNE